MYLKIVLESGAKQPTKAHEDDAGFDLYSRDHKTVKAGSAEVFDTGVHIGIPAGLCGFLKSKSGLNVHAGIQSEGVIDSGYTGSIMVKLYNHSQEDYEVQEGDKISQIVFLPIPHIILRKADALTTTERGDLGFGSSGK